MILKAKKIKLLQMNFFWKTTNKTFMYLLAPFILQNFKKILRADPKFHFGCVIFGPKMDHLSRAIFFWYKPLLLLSYTYWPFSLCKIFKKFLQGIQRFWAQNGSFAANNFFWKKLISFSSTYWPLSFCKI